MMNDYDQGFWDGYNDAISRRGKYPQKQTDEYAEGYTAGYLEGENEYDI